MKRGTKAGVTVGLLGVSLAGAAALTLALAIVVLVAIAFVIDSKATTWVDEAVAAHVDADVSHGEVGISLFRSFPVVEIRVEDLQITGRAPFAGVDLATVDSAMVAVDATSLFGPSVAVRALSLERPVLDVRVDANGHDNRDIFRGEDEGSSGSYEVALDDVSVVDLALSMTDEVSGLALRIADLDLEASGVLNEQTSRFDTHVALSGLDARYGGVQWLQSAQGTAEGGLTYGQSSGAMTFEDLSMTLNALPLQLSGTLSPDGEAYEIDVAFSAPDSDFKALLSLVPDAYGASFDQVEASGKFTLQGTAQGRYQDEELPAFDLSLVVEDGSFSYPDLPSSVSRIGADVSVRHAQGVADLTEIDIRSFSLATAGSPFRGSAKIRSPATDPNIDAVLKGRLDLGALGSALPGSGAPSGTGELDLDVAVAGRMSDFQAHNTDAISASGTIRARDLQIDSDEIPVVLTVRKLDATLAAERVDIRTLKMSYDDSDLSISGQFDNILPYLLADADLTGSVALVSEKLDLRPFQGDEEDPSTAADTAEEGVLVAIPDNVVMAMTAQVSDLKTAVFQLSDVVSTVNVADSSLQMSSLDAELAGGQISLSGSYTAPTAESADLDLRIDALRFDLVRTLTTFKTVAKLVPFLDGATGRFNSDFSLQTRLDAQGNPDLSLVSSSGSLLPLDVNLESGVLVTAARKLRGLKSIRIDDAQVRYAFEKGRIEIRPFSTTLAQMPVNFSGNAGVLDQTLDLAGTVVAPTDALAGNPILDQVQGVLGDTVDVEVKITGDWTRPQIQIGLADGLAPLVDKAAEVVDDALLEAQKAGEVLLAKAREAGEALRTKAREAGDVLRREAAATGRKLKKEAGSNPLKKTLATEAAKKLSDEADKAAKKLEREANKAAEKLLAEAEAEVEALLEEASKASDKALRR